MPATPVIAPGAVKVHGDMVVSILDYGGKADNGVTDNYGPYQSAYAALKTKVGSNSNKIACGVYFPGALQPYGVSRPLQIEDSYFGILGDRDSTRITSTGYGPVVFGSLRTTDTASGNTIKLTSTHRPSRSGVLDGSFGGYGVRTNGDASITFTENSVTGGKISSDGTNTHCQWGEHTAMTFDFALERGNGSGGWPGSAGVEPMMAFGGFDSPFIFKMNKGGSDGQFDFSFTDSGGNTGNASCTTTNPTGLLRLTVQVDFAGKTFTAWAQGVQISSTTSGAMWGGGGTGVCARNEYNQFIIGPGTSSDGRPILQTYGATIADFAIFGMAISSAKRYNVSTTGSTQTRIDNGTINDAYRYGIGGDSNTFMLLYGSDPATNSSDPAYIASDPYTSRWVGAFNYDTFHVVYGTFWQAGLYTSTICTKSFVRDCILTAQDQRASCVLQLGPVLDFFVDHCQFTGGTAGFVQTPSVASYKLKVRDTIFDVLGNGVFAGWSEIDIADCIFNNMGRNSFVAWASNVRIFNCPVRQVNTQSRSYLLYRGGLYGQQVTCQFATVDDEGGAFIGSPIDIRQVPNVTGYFDFYFLDFQGGSNAHPCFYMRGITGQESNLNYVKAQSINAPSAQYSAFVTSAAFHGTVNVPGSSVHYTGTGSSNVTDV